MSQRWSASADRPGVAPDGSVAGRSRWQRTGSLAPWLLGVVAAVAAIGPGLGPGSWLNVDLVVTPVTPVPRGVWGMGPELPRRVPYALPIAWLSSVVDSTWLMKALMVVSISAAVAGGWRLAQRWFPDLPVPAAAGAGLLVGLNPFLLTRLGVGHLPLVMAIAMLPWALPSLLDPCRSDRRTFLWCAAIGCTGVLGGVLVLLAVPVALACSYLARRGSPVPGARSAGTGPAGTDVDQVGQAGEVDQVGQVTTGRVIRAIGLLLLSQVSWLVPGVLVLLQGAAPTAARDFATDGGRDGGAIRVLAGHGFWRATSEVGRAQGWVVPAFGILLLGMAAVGASRLAPRLRPPALGVAAVGLLIPMASALPGIRRLYSVLVDSPVGATLREGQRLLPLYLVVLAPLAAGGAAHLAQRWKGWREGALLFAPIAVALALAGPGLWGVNGALQPVHIPPAWNEARSIVRSGGGTVLSLPFYEYLSVSIAAGRSVVDPMPVFLGGDVISSSDPGLHEASMERNDPRETQIAAAVGEMRSGAPAAGDLASLGVRWVVLRHDYDREDLGLGRDPGLRVVISSQDLDLYEVRAWPGPAIEADGEAVTVNQPITPVASISGSRRVIWYRPGLRGWMRSWHAATTSAGGSVELPAGSGPVWFWPSAVTLLADLALGTVVVWALAGRRRTRHSMGDA